MLSKEKILATSEKIFSKMPLICVLILIGGGIYGTISLIPENIEMAETISIISLSEEAGITGSFVLGIGTVEGESQYIMYIQTLNGGFKRHTIPTDVTTIYEDEENNPYLSTYNIWAISKKTGRKISVVASDKYPYYELHVPKGTIKKEYNIGNSGNR